MASNPPMQCCTVGVKHEGTPAGKMETIADTEVYVATPKKAIEDTAVLLLTDVLGHKFENAQLLADQFAENGYLTYMPDLFKGDALEVNRPDNFDLQKWLSGHGVEVTEPIVRACVKHMHKELAVKKIGAVGYCFGGKYVVRALAHGGCDAGFVAHPSFVDEDELRKIKGPLSIAAAEIDKIFTADKRHVSEEILQQTGFPYQINLYSGVQHGFAVRADITKKPAKFAREQAFIQAVQWFDYYLKE